MTREQCFGQKGYKVPTREDDDAFWEKNHTQSATASPEEQRMWKPRSGAPYGGEERRKRSDWDGVDRRNPNSPPWNGLERRKK